MVKEEEMLQEIKERLRGPIDTLEDGTQYLRGPFFIYAAVGPLYSAVRVKLSNLYFTKYGKYAGMVKAYNAPEAMELLEVDPGNKDIPGARHISLVAQALYEDGKYFFEEGQYTPDDDSQLAWGTGFALPLIIRTAYLAKHNLIAQYPELQTYYDLLDDITIQTNHVALHSVLVNLSQALDRVYVDAVEVVERVESSSAAHEILNKHYGPRPHVSIFRVDLHRTEDMQQYSTLIQVGGLVSIARTPAFQDERLELIATTNKFGIYEPTTVVDEVFKTYPEFYEQRFSEFSPKLVLRKDGYWVVQIDSWKYCSAPGFTLSAGNLIHLGWFRRCTAPIRYSERFYDVDKAVYVVRSPWQPELWAIMNHTMLNRKGGEKRCKPLVG